MITTFITDIMFTQPPWLPSTIKTGAGNTLTESSCTFAILPARTRTIHFLLHFVKRTGTLARRGLPVSYLRRILHMDETRNPPVKPLPRTKQSPCLAKSW